MLMNVLHCIVCAPTLFPLMSERAPVRQVRTKPTDGGHTLNVATHMWQCKERPPVCTLNIKAKFFSKRQKVSVISLQSAGEFPPLLPTLSSPPPSLPPSAAPLMRQEEQSSALCLPPITAGANCVPTSCYASRRTNWQIL